MKNIIKIMILLLFTSTTNAQTNIVDVYDGVAQDAPAGTYFKDINNTFTKFLGTWKWQDGNKILTFKIEKVTQYFHQQYGVYEDFIIGNYSYTEDSGTTYIVNTITQNIGINNPDLVPLYSGGTLTQLEIKFAFTDVGYNKSSCNALFKFLPNSNTQVELKLSNRGGGYISPDTPPNPNFSIPNNVVLTKQ